MTDLIVKFKDIIEANKENLVEALDEFRFEVMDETILPEPIIEELDEMSSRLERDTFTIASGKTQFNVSKVLTDGKKWEISDFGFAEKCDPVNLSLEPLNTVVHGCKTDLLQQLRLLDDVMEERQRTGARRWQIE